MSKLTPQQVEERRAFVVGLVKDGLSRTDIQAQIQAQFRVTVFAAQKIYVKAIDTLIIQEPIEQKRTKAIVQEMLYHQISGLCIDINSLQHLYDTSLLSPGQATGIIQTKVKARGQIRLCLTDVARLNGLFADMPIIQAINVLSTHNLIPPAIAADMLRAIEGVNETVVEAMQANKKPESPTDEDFD
jgi:hypothetical protein